MKDNIFRKYDIRGVVGKDLLIEESYNLGCAIVTYLKQIHPNATQVIVARDGRTHSQEIITNLVQAITDLGLDVIDIGLTPTPVMYFAVHTLKNPTALIVTASHNTKEYNGIKIWDVSGDQIQEIKQIYKNKNFYQNKSGQNGTVIKTDMISKYLDYLQAHFSTLQNKSLHVAIDCGNGSAGAVIPQLIERMNWKHVTLLYPEVDGTFPNHEADPTVPENMKDIKQVLAQNPMLRAGIGLDGDCDRMNPMTPSGILVPGDKLLAVFAQKILEKYPQAAVVFDIKASSGLVEVLEKFNGKPVMSPSGHSLIKRAIKKHNAILAGELSCHFFFNDRYLGFDDGIYAALRLLEILDQTDKTFDQLLEIFPKKISSPEIRMLCSTDEEKTKIVDHVKTIFSARKDIDTLTIDGIRAQMTYGWGLIRASNTQPVICLRFESSTQNGFQQVKQDFYDALVPHFDAKKLKELIEL
ncbi:MAG: phosphomannomutase/phosphoglucomutase [bacterium]